MNSENFDPTNQLIKKESLATFAEIRVEIAQEALFREEPGGLSLEERKRLLDEARQALRIAVAHRN